MVKIDGKPRLCKLGMWPDFDGYGFNLHAEKSRPGQYVGKVDEGSPSEAAGLREGDRIIEVNGFNISSENHKQVVLRIKSIPNETQLLVVDAETDRIYRESGLVISAEDAIVITSSREEVDVTEDEEEEEDHKSLVSHDSSIDKRNLVEEESSLYIPTHGKIRSCHIIKNEASESFGFSIQTIKKENTKFIKEITPDGPADRSGLLLDDVVLAVNGENVIEETHKAVVDRIISRDLDTTLLVTDKETFTYCMEHQLPLIPNPDGSDSCKVQEDDHRQAPLMGSTGNSPSPRSTPSPQFSNSGSHYPQNGEESGEDLNLNMTAAQMRERISAKKKRDPRKDDRMDILRKYQIIQTL